MTSLSEQSEAQPTEHRFLFYKMMYCSCTLKSTGSYVRSDNFLQRSQQINFYVIKKRQNSQNQSVAFNTERLLLKRAAMVVKLVAGLGFC